MAEYGLTPEGPNIKRLDVILDEMHGRLTEKWGVNTRQNPQSFLNDLLTSVADKLAELWEFGEQVYYSQYPMSAEGSSLDDALQFAGITRELPMKSYYKILCTGLDGTVIPVGTIISTDTNPPTNLVNEVEGLITRAAFNRVVIVYATQSNAPVSVVINGTIYTAATLEELADVISASDDMTAAYADGKLTIAANDETSSNTLVLPETLTTETVGSIVEFPTEEYGDILLPNGVVNKITRAVTGLQEVVNVGPYVAGRGTESDADFRKSHIDKIFSQSSRMIESVRSAILQNVSGVKSCAVYENDTNETDAYGRPPHSIEVVVDGGDKDRIAEQIFDTKAGGISTCCTDDDNGVEVTVKGDYGEDIVIRFNRPQPVYVWFQVGVTFSQRTNAPTNYVELIKETLLNCMDGVEAGESVVPQKFTEELYNTVPGIDYFDIRLFSSTDPNATPPATPQEYDERSVDITPRQRAYTAANMIGVFING